MLLVDLSKDRFALSRISGYTSTLDQFRKLFAFIAGQVAIRVGGHEGRSIKEYRRISPYCSYCVRKCVDVAIEEPCSCFRWIEHRDLYIDANISQIVSHNICKVASDYVYSAVPYCY